MNSKIVTNRTAEHYNTSLEIYVQILHFLKCCQSSHLWTAKSLQTGLPGLLKMSRDVEAANFRLNSLRIICVSVIYSLES